MVSKKITDLTGKTINNLTVLGYAGVRVRPSGQRHSMWHCKCVCGKILRVLASSLKGGKQDSCGCLSVNQLGDASITHGARSKRNIDPIKRRLWRVWAGMRERCSNPNCKSWPFYGGRGIRTCAKWKLFQNFYNDMRSTYQSGLMLERMNNDWIYCRRNCCWATKREQAANTRRNIYLTHEGKTLCLSDWARIIGLSPLTLQQRFRRGKSAEEILWRGSLRHFRGSALG